MKHSPIHDTRFFFSTAPLPCPYLPDRVERRVVTELLGRDAVALHDGLSAAGFRRSHNIAYAPACPDCQACRAVRIVVDDFTETRSHSRIRKRNADLWIQEIPPQATLEQFELFVTYQQSRHSGGDMSKMDYRDYQSLIEDTPVETRLVEYRQADGELVAVCLLDRVEHGLSAVYSFFHPAMNRKSLGTYMILWLVDRARQLGLVHVYLGFWVEGCEKMSYKAKFQPLETWTVEGWISFHDLDAEAG
ncbi:MAG: arginyltransferase [Alphaproteobacteria bacterium]|nr:arginyltransferase [Alphaproteobacteria bacterium]